MRHYLRAFLLLAVLLPRPTAAQKIRPATVARVIGTLAADSLQGRAAGTAGSAKAARFLAAEFGRLGLQPLPGATGFEQTFAAYRSRTLSARATVGGVAVPAQNIIVIPGQDALHWSDATPDLQTVIVSPITNARQVFGQYLEPHQNTVLLVDTSQTAAFRRLAGFMHHYEMRARPLQGSTVLILAPTPNPGTPFQLDATAATGPVPLTNVVGLLPGREPARATEYVVFSGHYDHLGVLPAVAGDSIANGADDDASGTTAVVALAESFARTRRNARPLLFVAFTAEEIGGFGSRYFSEHLDPAQVVAMFNLEMIGKVAEAGPGNAYVTGYDKSDFGALLNQALGRRARFVPDPYPDQQLFYRSDNATLARQGVPAHTISTSRMPADKLYHSVGDEVATLDLRNMTAVITHVARSAQGIVSGHQTPTRIPKPEEQKPAEPTKSK